MDLSHILMILAWLGAIGWPVALFLAFWLRRRARRARAHMIERRKQGWSRQWRKPARTVVLAGLSVAWAFGVWAFLIEPELFVVRTVTVESATWKGPPLRIGLISDTHVGAPHVDGARMERIVARMNAQHPDMVVLLGDYVGGHTRWVEHKVMDRRDILRGLHAFKRLDAPLGTMAVIGNHDWYFDVDTIADGLADDGIKVLQNDAVRVDRADGPFWVAGLPDPVSNRQFPNFEEALAPVNDDAPIIALAHRPDMFAQAPSRVAIMLAGHSHCGQVNLPIVGRIFSASPGSKRWPCGAYDEDGRKLYVTGGVGVSMAPARFRQPPEIVILTLRERPARASTGAP